MPLATGVKAPSKLSPLMAKAGPAVAPFSSASARARVARPLMISCVPSGTSSGGTSPWKWSVGRFTYGGYTTSTCRLDSSSGSAGVIR
jgi:hypothetical protein